MIEVGGVVKRLCQPLIPEAICVAEQVAPIIARQFSEGLPDAEGEITTLYNLSTEIAFDGGIKPPPGIIAARIKTEARTARGDVAIAGLRVCGRQRNTLH